MWWSFLVVLSTVYGAGKLNSLKEAVVKGAKAGTATAGIHYVGDHLNSTKGSSYSEIESRTYTGTYLFPYKQYVDRICHFLH